MENQPNLLAIHAGLSELRDVSDQASEQVKGAEGESGQELIDNLTLESGVTLRDYFSKLDEVVDWFDEHVGQACINLIPLVQAGNNGLVVRLGLVIEEEEKKDRQTKALQGMVDVRPPMYNKLTQRRCSKRIPGRCFSIQKHQCRAKRASWLQRQIFAGISCQASAHSS